MLKITWLLDGSALIAIRANIDGVDNKSNLEPILLKSKKAKLTKFKNIKKFLKTKSVKKTS